MPQHPITMTAAKAEKLFNVTISDGASSRGPTREAAREAARLERARAQLRKRAATSRPAVYSPSRPAKVAAPRRKNGNRH